MEKKQNFSFPEKSYGNFPEKSYGKFVQLYLNEEPYIRFSVKPDERHMNLLAKVLDEFEIKGFENLVGRPKLKGQNYEAVGMGQFSRIGNDILLIGRSIDYGLTPNEKHLKDLSSYLPFEIKINIS